MTNEELTIKIQDGRPDLIPELWKQVERFVAHEANKRLKDNQSINGAEFDDLYDSGFIALAEAIERFKPDRGNGSFLTIFSFCLRSAFSEAIGCRSERQKKDPLHRAQSIDSPITADSTEDITLADTIEDESAQQEFINAEDSIYNTQLHAALESAISKLDPIQAEIVRDKHYNGKGVNAGDHKKRYRYTEALRNLRHDIGLRRFIEDRTPYYRHIGLLTFKNFRISETEATVFKREELRGEKI